MMDGGRRAALAWGPTVERVTWGTRAALALCLATAAWVIVVWRHFGRDDLPLDARAALSLVLAPWLVAGLCGALRRMAARRWRGPFRLAATALGGVVGLSALFPLLSALYLPMLALSTLDTANRQGTATLLLLAALLALAGGLALAVATHLLRAVIALDALPQGRSRSLSAQQ